MLWLIALGSALAADEAPEFTPEVQVRPRMEAHTGRDGVKDEGDSLWISQRSRIGGTMKLGPTSARVVVQDVRGWGTEADTLGDLSADAIDVRIAYLTYKPTKGVKAIIGRQEINLHEQRLIGAVDWTQQGRVFDGGMLKLKGDSVNMDVFGAMLYEGNQVDADERDSTLWGFRGGWASDNAVVDLVAIWDHFGELETDRQTVGVYAKGGSGALSGRAEAYYQMGSVGDDGSIAAWMAGVQGTFAPDHALKPQITLWYDHLSGDDDPTDGDITFFNTLYATNHKFYGRADMAVFGQGGMADGRGLQDIALKAAFKPVKKLKVNLDIHHFMASDPQGGDSAIAQEVDLWAGTKLADNLSLGAGAAMWLSAVDGADNDMWGFLMLDAKY